MTSQCRFSPRPSLFYRFHHSHTLLIVFETSRAKFISARSLMPEGVCPRSYPRAIASTSSSLSRSAFAIVLAFVTPPVYVSALCGNDLLSEEETPGSSASVCGRPCGVRFGHDTLKTGRISHSSSLIFRPF